MFAILLMTISPHKHNVTSTRLYPGSLFPAVRVNRPLGSSGQHAKESKHEIQTINCVSAITLFSLPLPHQLAAQQTVSGTNGRIAFIQGDPNGVGPTNIVTANPDGLQQNPLPLLPELGRTSSALWSGPLLRLVDTERSVGPRFAGSRHEGVQYEA
jgi:hypothetical protein